MRRSILLLVLLSSTTFLAGLGWPAIGDSDEAFYAEAGREMVELGDWLTPHYNYEYRFQKPILFYWLVAGSFATLGVGEAQARLWAGLAGIGLALATFAIGRRSYDESTGLLAGAIVATAFGYFSIGRLSLPDLPLAFFITVAIQAALAGSLDEDEHATRWLLLAGLAAGCAFLTKGPVGIVVPALVIGPIWALERRRLRLTVLQVALALLTAALVAVPWYAAMTLVHGRTYLDSFFVGDNLERFATTRFNDPRPLWFYLPITVGGMLPWTPLALAAIPPIVNWAKARRPLRSRTWRMLAWAFLPLAFFTASIGKQPRYILPILPPLAVLLAATIMDRVRTHNGRDALLQGPAAIVAALLGALAFLLYRAQHLVVMVPTVFIFAAIIAIAVAAVIVLAAALAPRARLVPAAVAIAGALTLAGLQYGLSPGGRDPVQDMAALVTAHRTLQEPIATYRVFVRNLVFYTGIKQIDLRSDQQVVEYLRSTERVLCVIDEKNLRRLEEGAGFKTNVLGGVLYFNASAVKLRTFLHPDARRDLERVLLVSNR